MSELLELCLSNDLSFDALQEKINSLGARLSSQDPSCLHRACFNMKVTLKIVQLLYNTFPGAFRLRNSYGRLPIHRLCMNERLDETTSIDILRFMLEIDPNLSREVDVDNGYLPIHLAVEYKSTAFCKELIDAYPESLRIQSSGGWLPIHRACRFGNRDYTVDTIQYMLEMDSEIINAEDRDGYLPIHLAARRGRTKLIELMLKFDPNAASKEVNNDFRRLPLHLVCGGYNPNLSSTQALYDVYPDAILISDENGRTPLDLAEGHQHVMDFLQTQLLYAHQAQDEAAMTTLDENGRLPLHHAPKDDAPLGSIKLLVRGNPAAVQVADQNGAYPVHIACELSSAKVVKYLVELAGDALNNVDAKNNSPLHYSCRGGNCDVIKFLLEANVPSVSDRNNNNKLAIHLLFECGEGTLDRDCLEYVETVHQLLLANQEVLWDFMS